MTFILRNVKAEYDVARYCQLVPKGTKFPSYDSCQTYYTCLNENDVEKSTCSGTQVFNKDLQKCVNQHEGNCKALSDEKNPCEGLHATFAKHPKDCHWWHYCENGKVAHSATCPSGQYFNGKSCVFGKCGEEEVEVKDLCEIMPTGQFFGDFDDCTVWQKCQTNGAISQGKCVNKNVSIT